MKKFLTNTEKNKIIKEREKAIIESFAKNYNRIKRLDEDEVKPISESLLAIGGAVVLAGIVAKAVGTIKNNMLAKRFEKTGEKEEVKGPKGGHLIMYGYKDKKDGKHYWGFDFQETRGDAGYNEINTMLFNDDTAAEVKNYIVKDGSGQRPTGIEGAEGYHDDYFGPYKSDVRIYRGTDENEEIDENEIPKETSLEKTGEIVANKLEQVLSPEEINFLKQAYTKGGKEMVAKAIERATNNSANEGAEPPAEGDMGMSRNEIKLRQILDKIISYGAIGGVGGIIPAAAAGASTEVVVGLAIAALVGFMFKDAAWWKSKGHHYDAQDKYGLKENDEDYEKIGREVEYGINPYEEQPSKNELNDDLLEFDIPEWALSSLINGDDSGLEDDDIRKIEDFTSRVVSKYGNAHFMMNDIEGEDNLGFKHSNDIDNLGSNVYRLYIRPSKSEEPMNEYGLQENNGDNLNKNQSGIDQNTTLAYKIIKKITDLLKDDMYSEPDEYGMTTPELLKAFYYNFDSVDDGNGKLIGFKKGDLTSFVKRAKNYLMNRDFVVIGDNGVIDVNNSNHPEVAKLLKKLETL
jgi:hypothetical protein